MDRQEETNSTFHLMLTHAKTSLDWPGYNCLDTSGGAGGGGVMPLFLLQMAPIGIIDNIARSPAIDSPLQPDGIQLCFHQSYNPGCR